MPPRRPSSQNLQWWSSTLGGLFREERLRQGMSLRELERRSGVSDSEVYKIESGNPECRLRSFVSVCAALGLPPGWVLDDVLFSGFPEFAAAVSRECGLIEAKLREHCPDATPRLKHAITDNIATLASFVHRLARCSNPRRQLTVSRFIPPAWRDPLIVFADRIDVTDDPRERITLIAALEEHPVRELDRHGFLSGHFFDEIARDARADREIPIFWPIARPIGFDKPAAALFSVDTMANEQSRWGSLRERVIRLTAERGAKTKLARRLGVSKQLVSAWLSNRKLVAPNANITLALAEWVAAAEKSKNESAGRARTRPAPKTQKRKSTSHEKAKSDQQKK